MEDRFQIIKQRRDYTTIPTASEALNQEIGGWDKGSLISIGANSRDKRLHFIYTNVKHALDLGYNIALFVGDDYVAKELEEYGIVDIIDGRAELKDGHRVRIYNSGPFGGITLKETLDIIGRAALDCAFDMVVVASIDQLADGDYQQRKIINNELKRVAIKYEVPVLAGSQIPASRDMTDIETSDLVIAVGLENLDKDRASKISDIATHLAIAESADFWEYYIMLEYLETPEGEIHNRELAEWILDNNYQTYLDM